MRPHHRYRVTSGMEAYAWDGGQIVRHEVPNLQSRRHDAKHEGASLHTGGESSAAAQPRVRVERDPLQARIRAFLEGDSACSPPPPPAPAARVTLPRTGRGRGPMSGST